ncbi:Response regulator receiver protein [Candidatus Desulfosporosinus infrequens]|uniref:Stage 0 sporulation protein A homolog n=1 Tax=Candidatus Desulfosporosinus infrequens TaxID=2043169 RepID=A0A2U3LKK6_9FIRM|nr:Response regulator receiver protein [Candidatus Desulfosporosinus infrequens]
MNNKVLLVDDDFNILQAYTRALRSNFKVSTATNGADGLQILKEEGPFAVVVTDYRMPKMDGIQFLAHTKGLTPDTIRIMLSGQADMEVSIQAVNEGNIFRFLNKPCPTEQLIKVLNAATEQYRLVMSERELLEKTLKGSVKLLLDISNAVNPRIFSRASRIRTMANGIAARLKIEKYWEVELAAMLSQIGCTTIPPEILKRKDEGEQLSDEETQIFLTHAQTGRNLLRNIPRLESISEGVFYQFKQFDGQGFPFNNIKGKDIPLIGRILKVVLDFDTLTSEGNTAPRAVEELLNNTGYYDPDIFAALDAEVLRVATGFVVNAVAIADLVNGMLLADDLIDNYGSILLYKGQEITDILKLRLIVFARLGRVAEPIRILKPI